ncbi:hypothetical protein [Rhizobium leguminosarum]|jgi:hypothetical protein|uniref:hypothetical protein n=1 Tax=Rhizobium leguminosarum TaxID=384 RepID=UPI002E145A81|nr:hypothetical protein U8Q02_39310 [Rhizobium leguminosarum]
MTKRTFDEICDLAQRSADSLAASALAEIDAMRGGPIAAMSMLDSMICQVLVGVVDRMPQFGPPEKLLKMLVETLPTTMAADMATRGNAR